MSRKRRWRVIYAGLIAGTASGTPALGQEPMSPVSGPVIGSASIAPAPPGLVLDGSDNLVQRVPAGVVCSCGDRLGFSRLRHHHRVCKRHLQESVIGYPETFVAPPLGWWKDTHNRTMVSNATAAKMVFYHYDFVDGTTRLNVRGQDKLARVSRLVSTTFCPVIVERTPREPGLDEGRRLTLLANLAAGPFPVPAERVVVGPPIAGGMNGVESGIIYSNRLNQTATGGATGAIGTGTAGFDASGLSGFSLVP